MNGKPEYCWTAVLIESDSAEVKGGDLREAFTLLEVIVALAIVSILALALQTPVGSFHQQIVTQQMESGIGMGIRRFQLLLKAELARTGYGMLPSEKGQAIEIVDGILVLKADLNQDGDLNDAKEQIFYQFDADRQMLLRRSGKGSYQRFIEGIAYLEISYWDRASDNRKTCLQLTIRVLKQSRLEESILCPLSPF
ncbi:MAG: type II secretion system protein [SAR324 cluster bacterium]|nr:type II secretion system protein [SAR324 cluster bacterium]